MSAISTQGQFVDNEIARFCFRISSLDNWIEWQQQVKTGYENYKSGYGNGDILLLIKGDLCSNPMPPVVYEWKIIPPQDQRRRLKLLKLVHDAVLATAGTWSKRQLLRTLAFETPAFRSLLFVDFIRLSQLYGDGGTSIWWWNKSLARRVLVLYYLSPSFRLYLIMWPIDNVDTSTLHHVCVPVVVCSSSTCAAPPSSICHRLVFILSVLHNSDIEMHAIQE